MKKNTMLLVAAGLGVYLLTQGAPKARGSAVKKAAKAKPMTEAQRQAKLQQHRAL